MSNSEDKNENVDLEERDTNLVSRKTSAGRTIGGISVLIIGILIIVSGIRSIIVSINIFWNFGFLYPSYIIFWIPFGMVLTGLLLSYWVLKYRQSLAKQSVVTNNHRPKSIFLRYVINVVLKVSGIILVSYGMSTGLVAYLCFLKLGNGAEDPKAVSIGAAVLIIGIVLFSIGGNPKPKEKPN